MTIGEVSKKNKNGDGYTVEFSDYCTYIGSAFIYATTKLMNGDRIKLTEIDVTSIYNKKKDRQFIDFKVFECEPVDGNNTPSRTEGYPFGDEGEGVESNESDDSEDLPF